MGTDTGSFYLGSVCAICGQNPNLCGQGFFQPSTGNFQLAELGSAYASIPTQEQTRLRSP